MIYLFQRYDYLPHDHTHKSNRFCKDFNSIFSAFNTKIVISDEQRNAQKTYTTLDLIHRPVVPKHSRLFTPNALPINMFMTNHRYIF